MNWGWDQVIQSDAYKELHRQIIVPFVLEFNGKFNEAIVAHERAATLLESTLEKIRKKIQKFQWVMFERQMEVHKVRKQYLESLSSKRNFDGAVVPPTILSADKEIKNQEGNPNALSWAHKMIAFIKAQEAKGVKQNEFHERSLPNLEAFQKLLADGVPPFAPTLGPSFPPIIYQVSHSSELLWLGLRSHWLYVKDETNTHTLYVMQAIWSIDIPITEALLRRAGEFLPGAGAVHVNIIKTKGGSFQLEMENLSTGPVTETPDRGGKTKHWSPRRFEYGGRKFVWKGDKNGGVFGTKFKWETLHETRKVWPAEGSKTGKMGDETVGEKLCWGVKNSGMKVSHTLYFAGGLDQYFREHLLASQLSKYLRCTYPPNKDTGGAEKAKDAASLLELMVDLAS